MFLKRLGHDQDEEDEGCIGWLVVLRYKSGVTLRNKGEVTSEKVARIGINEAKVGELKAS